MSKPSESLQSVAVDLLIGGASAGISKVVSAPFERSKLLLQAQDELLRQGRLTQRYSGTFDCISRIVKEEGFFSLWRGVLPSVVRYYPTQILNFALKDAMKDLFGKYDPKKEYWKWFLSNLASGLAAGAISLAVVYPLDYATTRLACDVKVNGRYQFDGVLDVLKQTIEGEQGFAGCYSGFAVSIYGIVAYRGIYFGLYDSCRAIFQPKSFIASFCIGWGVTVLAGLMTYPLDTIRRRMMLRGDRKGEGTIGTTKGILKHEGVIGLMRGSVDNIIRSVLAALALALYDQVQLAVFGGGKSD